MLETYHVIGLFHSYYLPSYLCSLIIWKLFIISLISQAHGGNSESSGVDDLFNSHVEHLTGAYSNFLKRWDRLIDLEARSSQVYF